MRVHITRAGCALNIINIIMIISIIVIIIIFVIIDGFCCDVIAYCH